MFGQKCASTSDSPPHPIFTHHHQNYYISHCTCEKAAENGAFGCCFRHPFHHTPTRASGRFNLFLGSGAPSAQRASTADFCCSRFRHPLSLTPLLPQRDLFWLHELCPQNGLLSIYLAHHGSRYIYRPSPLLPYPSSPSKIRRLLSFQADARFKS